MRKFQRGEEPEFLAQNWEAWGGDWALKHAAGKPFYWHEVGGEPVNQKLLPFLKAQTQAHCSFCDSYPVSPPSIETIEHFRPKTRFHREAYYWPNLYFSCTHCQQKGVDFDEAALQPDAADYEFDRYFRWDFTQGRIEMNEQATPVDRQRAEITIRLYRLNERHPSCRKLWAKRRSKLKEEPLDEFPYRDFVQQP